MSLGTSHFYEHCIEPIFPCGDEGFALEYAKKRAEIIESKLELGQELRQYLESTEECFQEGYYRLVDSKKTLFPNKGTCLEIETEAVAILNTCYRKIELCSLLSSTKEVELLYNQTHSIVKAFRIGSHYHNNTLVNMGLPSAIKELCPDHTDLANALTTSEIPVRVLLCGASPIYASPSSGELQGAEYIPELSRVLNRSADQFAFYGEDTDSLCSSVNPLYVPNAIKFTVIAWFASPDDPLLSRPYNQLFTPSNQHATPPYQYIGFEPSYQLRFREPRTEQREHSQCGDGIRQIGESCDFKGNIGSGCSSDCSVELGYVCSTDNLTPSKCWPQDDPTQERIACPTGRRRSDSTKLSASAGDANFFQAPPVDSEVLGTSSASSMRTINLPLTILIGLISLFLSRR